MASPHPLAVRERTAETRGWQCSPAEYRELYDRVREWEAATGQDGLGFYERASLPLTPEDFASEAIWVIVGGGIKHTVARLIERRVFDALRAGLSAIHGLRHPAKARAIDYIWGSKARLHAELCAAAEQGDAAALAWIRTLPFLKGPALSLHFAKNIGLSVAKPDVHLARIAAHCGETVQGLCERLSVASGHKVAVVDYVLFRSAEQGWINTRALAAETRG